MPGFTRSAYTYALESGHFLLFVPMSPFCCTGSCVYFLHSTVFGASRQALEFSPRDLNINNSLVKLLTPYPSAFVPTCLRRQSYINACLFLACRVPRPLLGTIETVLSSLKLGPEHSHRTLLTSELTLFCPTCHARITPN